MKKFYAFVLTFSLALLALTPLSLEMGSARADDVSSVEEISSAADLQNVAVAVNGGTDDYSGKVLTLTDDITITGNWTPIGSVSNPFRGSLDGAGYSINIENANVSTEAYQGLFGYAEGGEFKNVQLVGQSMSDANGDLTTTYATDQIFAGMLMGYGSNVVIESCELLSEQNQTVKIRNISTIGALAGKLSSSTVKNVVSYANLSFDYELANTCRVRIGGVIGEAEYVNIEKLGSFGTTNLTYSSIISPQIASTFYVGGMIGDLKGGSIIDSVQGSAVGITSRNDVDSYVCGSLFGIITNSPANGNLQSIAYAPSGTGSEQLGICGEGELQSADYIVPVSEQVIFTTSFYTNGTQDFAWKQDAEIWDFESTWVIVSENSSQLRLQIFQFFDITLSGAVDSNNLLASLSSQTQNERTQYGKQKQLQARFQGENEGILVDNSKYYEISEIRRNGSLLSYVTFEESPSGEMIWQGEDVTLTKTQQAGSTVYTLKVTASSATEGEYSFVLSPINYPVYIVAGQLQDGTIQTDANGGVRYRGNADENESIIRSLYKGNTIEVESIGHSTYAFGGWTLYYLNSQGDVTYNGQRWSAASSDLFESTANPLSITFGGTNTSETAFNQTFLLVASFVSDPCTLTFSYDSNFITRVEVNGQNVGGSGTSVILDKNQNVTLRIYMSENASLNADNLLSSIRSLFVSDSSRLNHEVFNDLDGTGQVVHEFTFSTSAINYATSSQFNLNLSATEGVDDGQTDNTIWIVVGVVGGVILLAAIGLTVWLVLRRKALNNTRNDDYKRYYY